MATKEQKIATFAGGCFWCMQHAFDILPGVIKTIVGYTGGSEPDPSYQQVSYGKTSHLEAIQIYFDPTLISYSTLVEFFLHQIDPTDDKGQFADRGPHYCTAIFYHDELQKQIVESVFEHILATSQLPHIYTKILPSLKFYPAEDYHQKYSEKNKERYQLYHMSCGRDYHLKELWKTK